MNADRPSRAGSGGGRLLAVPPALLAGLVAVVCVLTVWFFGGTGLALFAGGAAVAGSVWGACLVLAFGDRSGRRR